MGRAGWGRRVDLLEWLALARVEEANSLHRYNFEREQGYGDPVLTAKHTAFETYIASNARPTADAMLGAFFTNREGDFLEPGGPVRPAAETSPPLRNDSPRVFLKSLAAPEDLLSRFGINVIDVRDAKIDVAHALNAGPISSAEEQRLQEGLSKLIPVAPASPVAAPAHRVSPRFNYRSGAAPNRTWQRSYWWFSFEDDLAAEVDPLPTPLERSGHVAGLRAALGVTNQSDAIPDATFAAGYNVSYRIFFQVAVTTPDTLDGHFIQPTMFSGGDPRLFVSARPDLSGGRTIRLKDLHCRHSTPVCRCADIGLPEGVAPANGLMDRACDFRVRGVFLALHRDLARFVAPSCDEIRDRRTLA